MIEISTKKYAENHIDSITVNKEVSKNNMAKNDEYKTQFRY